VSALVYEYDRGNARAVNCRYKRNVSILVYDPIEEIQELYKNSRVGVSGVTSVVVTRAVLCCPCDLTEA